jgi:hypothetical protein
MAAMSLRLHIAVAAAVVAGGVLVVLLGFGDREGRFAGTNSVGQTDTVALVRRGQELCVRDLWLPRGAAAVTLGLGRASGPPAPVDLTLTAGGRVLRSRTVVTRPRTSEALFRVPEERQGGPARLCLRSRGRVLAVAGTPTEPFQGTNYTPTGRDVGIPPNAAVDGRPLPGLVAVGFREAGRASSLDKLGDAARRASLFRPGWVGPWTYLALLIAVPLLWVVGLAALWRARR